MRSSIGYDMESGGEVEIRVGSIEVWDGAVRSIEVDLDFLEGCVSLRQVQSKMELETFIATLYKRKGKKVLPVNVPLQHGVPPGGNLNESFIVNGDFIPTVVPRGSRLTL